MELYRRLLGHPFVYDHVRPLVVGGIDMSPFYGRLDAREHDVVLDVGCGTGDALRYLTNFKRYVGFDTDSTAIESARRKHAGRPHASFVCAPCGERDVVELAPTVVALCGLLHHLTDAEAIALLASIRNASSVRRITTSDIVYLDGEVISNALAYLDRGRHCRTKSGYHDLVDCSGLRLVDSTIVRSHPRHGLAKYLLMTLEPVSTSAKPAGP